MSLMKLGDITTEICRRTDFKREDVETVVELVFPVILEFLLRGDDVMIVRFGRFNLWKRPPRVCTDARTGKPTMSSWKALIKFKPSRMVQNQMAVLTNPEYDWGDDSVTNIFLE